MKTLSSVILVLAVAAAPAAWADSAYFLRPAARPASTVPTSRPAVTVSTDRVSVGYRPTTRATVGRITPTPTVRQNRLFTRGAGQAAIVR